MGTAVVPLLVIAPNYPRFKDWCRTRGLSPRLAIFVREERALRGITNRHLVIVDQHDCPYPCPPLHLAARLAETGRLTVHYSTTADRPELTGEELRARYGDQTEMLLDAEPVLQLAGLDDIDRRWAVAWRYSSLGALEAFAADNARHYGYESIGPVIGPDGLLYGVTILKLPGEAEGARDDAATANTR